MTAISPYAPPSRNSLLRRRSSSNFSSSGLAPHQQMGGGGGSGTRGIVGQAAMAILLFALGFWKDSPWVQRFLRRFRLTTTNPLLTVRQNNVDKDNGDDDQCNDDDDDPPPQPMILSRIQENQRLIQKVLNYWFGQYSPDESQKHLWMIAHSSQALRKTVDQEITTEFQQLLLELSDGSLEEPSVRWKEWCGGNGNGGVQQQEETKWLYGHQGKIAAIIVLDQFSRHMLRHYETHTESASASPLLPPPPQRPVLLPSKEHLDAWALHTAQVLAKEHVQEINCGMLPVPMYIFSLMPFRHANTIETVQLVQHRVEELASLNHQMEAMVGRFRKATNRRMAVLQDEDRRSGGAREQTTGSNDSVHVGNGTNTMPNDENILETFPFDADMGPATNHPCIKTIEDFLGDRGIRPPKKDTNDPTTIPIIVSLSGGVDSMVIASVLVHLRESCGYQLDLWAVHIDYANRPESGAEADFVRRYCERLGISFQIRRIDEVTRGVTARDDYERIARDLRYTCYRETINQARNKKTKKGGREEETIGVMLGHHRGDLRENVLSNAHKGCGPLDLSGMTAVSQNDGVVIYRPLLPLEKTSIFDYAHKFGVPYFKDTTPHWSTRGKLRNQLIPLLEEIYGEGSMKNLSNLAVDSDECRALLQQSMIGPFLDRVQRFPMGIAFETNSWKEQALFFWKVVLREALHSASFGMFSDKSVVSFLERVQAKNVREGWLQCRRDYAVYLQGDGRVFVLFPSSFPFNKKDIYDIEGQSVAYDEERRVGPWIVKAEIVSEDLDCPETLGLEERALQSMSHLMKGVIEYMMEVPTTWDVNGNLVPRPLVFCRFNKASRPAAWKNQGSDENLYRKVQETLPLLGNANFAQPGVPSPSVHVEGTTGEVKPTTKRMVRVTLRVDRS